MLRVSNLATFVVIACVLTIPMQKKISSNNIEICIIYTTAAPVHNPSVESLNGARDSDVAFVRPLLLLLLSITAPRYRSNCKCYLHKINVPVLRFAFELNS